MAKLQEGALRRLIRGGETSTVEFKVAIPRPVEMAERLCGMANAQGGKIIVGVEDVERKVVGVPAERMAITKDLILRAARQIVKPALVLDPPEPETYELDGKQVVVASVPANNGSIYQSGGVFWVWKFKTRGFKARAAVRIALDSCQRERGYKCCLPETRLNGVLWMGRRLERVSVLCLRQAYTICARSGGCAASYTSIWMHLNPHIVISSTVWMDLSRMLK
jgi:hypothetical protein